jgi:DHA3 family tetracycline resistance protein-like MFS transporter
VEKRVDSTNSLAIGRSLFLVTGTISIALIGFAISPVLALSLILYLVVGVLRNVHIPLQTGWINQKLDSQVRATVHSMFGQVDAVGQMMGGPLVAGIAAAGSAVASLVTSGLLLTPALFFIQRANSQSTREPDREAEPVPVD